jgi:hypothetical protein
VIFKYCLFSGGLDLATEGFSNNFTRGLVLTGIVALGLMIVSRQTVMQRAKITSENP